MTIAVVVSLLLGLAGVGVGVEALRRSHGQHKVAPVPATSIVAPTSGSTVGGTVVLAAVPISPTVTAVDFIATGGTLHDTKIATGTASIDGFGVKWDTTTVPNGVYAISSIGYNAAGHSSVSPSIDVDVKNIF